MTTETEPSSPEACAILSTEGLALGDAFGERFFGPPREIRDRIHSRTLPEGPWAYTDDTVMALGIVEMLRDEGDVDQDRLAEIFARRYADEPRRGYGGNARRLLERIADGADWRTESHGSFNGQGSFGNGAAMRVPPIGGYWADDLEATAGAARKSAEITHAHPEGIAGAIAVAVAAASAWRTREDSPGEAREAMFDDVLGHTPAGEVHDGIREARGIGAARPISDVADELGAGRRVTAMDTVPFVVWCAAHHLEDFEEAMWQTVAGLGDRDTTCAMVGGIVALRIGPSGLPDEWRERCEPLDW